MREERIIIEPLPEFVTSGQVSAALNALLVQTIKIRLEKDGRRWEIGVPIQLDDQGEWVMDAVHAIGAAELLRAEAFPETVIDRSPKMISRRKNRKRKP